MKFSALVEILKKADMVTDITLGEDCDVEDLNLMDRDYRNCDTHTIYFIDASQIGPATAIPNCLLYFGEFPLSREKSLINSAKISAGSIAAVFQYVKLQLDSAPQAMEQYVNLVSKLMSGEDLQSVLTDAYKYTRNLFVAIDMSGKILTHSTPFYVDYPLWMNSVQQGFCDEILMDYIESCRKTLHMPKGLAPFELYCQKIDMYIMVARIIHENDLLGYFFALSRKPTFPSHTKKLLPLFAQQAQESLLRLKNVNSYNAIMQTNILLDAITGATPKEIHLRAKISGLNFQEFMRVFVIKSAYSREPDFYSQRLMPAISRLMPNQPCFTRQSSLVCLVGTDANGLTPKGILNALDSLASRHHLLVGISNVFSDISGFAEHFEQAQTALSFANRVNHTRPFFFYLDYAMYMILDRIDDENFLGQCCHPALNLLTNYDAKKGTELFNTLRIYTEKGFSKNRAAQELFIHRNTINYRIQQIEHICGIDLSDEKLLFTLQLSFNLYSYRKSRLISG